MKNSNKKLLLLFNILLIIVQLLWFGILTTQCQSKTPQKTLPEKKETVKVDTSWQKVEQWGKENLTPEKVGAKLGQGAKTVKKEIIDPSQDWLQKAADSFEKEYKK